MSKAFKLQPAVKSYIWGGNYFQKFGKGNQEVISELWELSARGEDSSLIVSGPLKSKKLSNVLDKLDLGPNTARFPYFPLLIKLIDAKENLSVQVHPSDDYALANENSFGKSEMWHIIDADENAGLYIGLKRDSSRDEISAKLNDGSILDVLNFVKVKPGDTFMINPGTIHAIGKGVRLIEIQQNSDLTYRLYDYNRVDKNGNKRELHILKALNVIDYKKYIFNEPDGYIIGDSKYFKVERIEFNRELTISANQGSFVSFTFIKGRGKVDDIPFNTFDTFFLPNNESCKIEGEGTVIVSRV